ncbi:hypothetical protein WJX73_005791 [Symbiochloris irregularis]|uniref:E2F/DP family winged-helix DNA-binding domain-containing protein n=1 Tax=Symbiochloris irregularis TaxID=706552 RepID=A0AAW1Q3V9_9CHLO
MSSRLREKRAVTEVTDDEDYKVPSRKDKSLGALCDKIMRRYGSSRAESHTICLDESKAVFGVERRRMYDIMNVLERLSIVSRQHKNTYTWHGLQCIPAALTKLRIPANAADEDNQQHAGHGDQDLKANQRRLYDILNILKALGLIEQLQSGQKAPLRWQGPLPDDLSLLDQHQSAARLPHRKPHSQSTQKRQQRPSAVGRVATARAPESSISVRSREERGVASILSRDLPSHDSFSEARGSRARNQAAQEDHDDWQQPTKRRAGHAGSQCHFTHVHVSDGNEDTHSAFVPLAGMHPTSPHNSWRPHSQMLPQRHSRFVQETEMCVDPVPQDHTVPMNWVPQGISDAPANSFNQADASPHLLHVYRGDAYLHESHDPAPAPADQVLVPAKAVLVSPSLYMLPRADHIQTRQLRSDSISENGLSPHQGASRPIWHSLPVPLMHAV